MEEAFKTELSVLRASIKRNRQQHRSAKYFEAICIAERRVRHLEQPWKFEEWVAHTLRSGVERTEVLRAKIAASADAHVRLRHVMAHYNTPRYCRPLQPMLRELNPFRSSR